MESGDPEPKRRSWVFALLYVVLGGVSIAALFDNGVEYRHFDIAQVGVQSIESNELAFYVWYALWGSLAVAFFALAGMQTGLPERLLYWTGRLLVRPWYVVAIAAAAVVEFAIVLRNSLFLGHPIADDESTYAFIAQTLLQGRVINPLPPDPGFFQNQFVILNQHGWFGRYPIGHPMVLAIGEIIHARWLIVPLLGAASVLLTFAIGRRFFGDKAAALGACLLLVSPQFVFTHATQLSQPTSATAMLLGIWLLLRLHEEPRLRWALLAGAVWGFELLVRPMPGALFLVAALVGHIAHRFEASATATRIALWKVIAAAAPGVALGACTLFVINQLQTGDPLTSGYGSTAKGYGGALRSVDGFISNSIAGAWVRQNFWLLGWTLSFALLPFARAKRDRWLFWGMLVAVYAYRVLVPKTVVSTTGPVYVFEAIPLFVLATADGARRVAGLLARVQVSRSQGWVASVMVAATLVALLAFVPVQMRTIIRSGTLRDRVYKKLESQGAHRALVFANTLVDPGWRMTWAYYPPNPAPTLDEDIIFVRHGGGPEGATLAYAFWRRHFADRRAFFFIDGPQGAFFEELGAKP